MMHEWSKIHNEKVKRIYSKKAPKAVAVGSWLLARVKCSNFSLRLLNSVVDSENPHTMTRRLLYTVVCCLVITRCLSQTENEILIQRGDSAYQRKAFSFCAEYYGLAAKRKEPATDSKVHALTNYNAACCAARAGDLVNALAYLRESFSTARTDNETPVSAEHIANDLDLKTLWPEPEFKSIINEYFTPSEAGIIFEDTKVSRLKESDLLKLIAQKAKEDNNVILIKNKIIEADSHNDSDDFIKISKIVRDHSKTLKFQNCTAEKPIILQEMELSEFIFNDCQLNAVLARGELKSKYPPQFIDCTFSDNLFVIVLVENVYTTWSDGRHANRFVLHRCTHKGVYVGLDNTSPTTIEISGNITTDSSDVVIIPNSTDHVIVSMNDYNKNNLFLQCPDIRKVSAQSNILRSLAFDRSSVTEAIEFSNNRINGNLLFHHTLLPEAPLSKIDWQELGDLKVGYFESDGLSPFNQTQVSMVNGENHEHIAQTDNFRELMKVYAMFLKLYKESNDMESFNRCYIDMKSLETQRLAHLYKENPTFERWFRWKLAGLLRFYVRYGTDPARALVISFYIILLFGIFFFFFPSDWDTNSKTQLIANFKAFVEKNEKGYVKPFFVLMGGFLLSLVNAVTLSLNAFVTLGFGNIPTHGVARYFCVIEGFLGWFLLSIFTVALINQVM